MPVGVRQELYRLAVHSVGLDLIQSDKGTLGRRSFRALAVAAGDGAGRHMVKMAHVVVKGPASGARSPRALPRAVTSSGVLGQSAPSQLVALQNVPHAPEHGPFAILDMYGRSLDDRSVVKCDRESTCAGVVRCAKHATSCPSS